MPKRDPYSNALEMAFNSTIGKPRILIRHSACFEDKVVALPNAETLEERKLMVRIMPNPIIMCIYPDWLQKIATKPNIAGATHALFIGLVETLGRERMRNAVIRVASDQWLTRVNSERRAMGAYPLGGRMAHADIPPF